MKILRLPLVLAILGGLGVAFAQAASPVLASGLDAIRAIIAPYFATTAMGSFAIWTAVHVIRAHWWKKLDGVWVVIFSMALGVAGTAGFVYGTHVVNWDAWGIIFFGLYCGGQASGANYGLMKFIGQFVPKGVEVSTTDPSKQPPSGGLGNQPTPAT